MKVAVLQLILAGCVSLLSISAAAADELGSLTTELPVEVEKNKQFDFEVGLSPASGEFKDSVTVNMQQNPNVDYDPRSFTLKPGQTQKVNATVKKSASGLAWIFASASNWKPISRSIHVAGSGVKLNVILDQPAESRRARNFSVGFTDEAGNPVNLEAKGILSLEASHGSNLLFYSEQTSEWTNEIYVVVEKENHESRPLQLKATSWVADTGKVLISLKTPDGEKVRTASFSIDIVPPWWLLMVMGMLGGLLYSVVQSLRNVLSSRRKRSVAAWFRQVSLAILLGIVPGALAYLFAAWNILGIKADTTSLKGFFILGFLFAYIGMDVVLKLSTVKKA
jgi:hypothetical protein